MSAMSGLACHLVEFGGDLETRDGWLARRADGTLAEGYRYAQLVRCRFDDCAGDRCDFCHYVYLGRTFVSDDAVAALVEIVEPWRTMPARWGS